MTLPIPALASKSARRLRRLSACHTKPVWIALVILPAAVVIAVGVNAQTGEREVLGFDVGPSEDRAFLTSFLRSLVARGLSGVRLVTSDAHQGLKSAVEADLRWLPT